MRRFLTLVCIVAALLSFGDITHAQDKTTQAAILRKLADIDNRLNEMDKRYEARFTKIETTLDERFNRIEDKFVAVNQRIDDKFNLMWACLVLSLLCSPCLTSRNFLKDSGFVRNARKIRKIYRSKSTSLKRK